MLCLCSSLAPVTVSAAPKSETGNLGVIGPVYTIQEEDFLQYIQRKLKELQRDGRLDAFNRDMKQKAEKKLKNLPPVKGIKATTSHRSYYFDPTITLPNDIKTPDGQLLARTGQRINPLDTISWSKQMLFIDGRDKRQVALAHRMINRNGQIIRPVLVAGDFMPLSRRWQLPVYYDQGGLLTERFGILRVPALVYQEGKRLRIDEIVP